MPGSLKEQSVPLGFAKFGSINDLFDEISKINFENMLYYMRDPSPKMKKKYFCTF